MAPYPLLTCVVSVDCAFRFPNYTEAQQIILMVNLVCWFNLIGMGVSQFVDQMYDSGSAEQYTSVF